jgi:short-subunit dehydrogenase
VALGGTFEQVAEADFEWLLAINFWGVVRMTRAFLPLLHKSEEARIVNISSVFGLIAPPGQTAYCASKFAVRGFSESLRHELARTNVGVTVVHPGGVATAISENARMAQSLSAEDVAERRKRAEAFLRLPPEVAGEVIVRGVENRKARVLVGADAKRMAVVERLMPVTYWNFLGRAFRR